MMASKFLHDEGEEDSVVNEDWATSAHMDVEELNRLERNFLAALVTSSSTSASSSRLGLDVFITVLVLVVVG